MIAAIQVDDAVDAEALLAEGLDADSEYEDDQYEVKGYRMQEGSALLHWAAVDCAPNCAKVCIARSNSIRSHPHVASDGWVCFAFSHAAVRDGRRRCVGGLPTPVNRTISFAFFA